MNWLGNRHLKKGVHNYGLGMCWPQTPNETRMIEGVVIFRKIKSLENLGNKVEEIKQLLKSTIRAIMKKKEKIPRRILTLLKALKTVCRDETIYISKPDKGNGVVIMDKSQYISNMSKILQDQSKFKEVPSGQKNIYIAKESQVNSKLPQLKKNKQIEDKIYQQLRSTGCKPSRLYGLLEVHKSACDPPMRPILSMDNSYCDNIAKSLILILKPFVSNQYTDQR